MIKTTRIGVMLVTTLFLLFVGNLLVRAQSTGPGKIMSTPYPSDGMVAIEVPNEIQSVLQRYFDLRYELLSVSPPSEITPKAFQSLIAGGEEANEFLVLETAKLEVVRKWYELRRLRYKRYDYQLEYKKIEYDSARRVATVDLVEKFTIIYESDNEGAYPDRGALKHTVVLRNENGQWKIVRDTYWDEWWRNYRKPGRSAEEVLRSIKNSAATMTNSLAYQVAQYQSVVASEPFTCGFGEDTSSHPYQRESAKDYAQSHAYNYNLYYPSYASQALGGDCTNFVSQAIYEGGNASMSIQTPLPPRSTDGKHQWYLLNGMQRASAWNDVGALYGFLVVPASWHEGPEGCEMSYRTEKELAGRLAQIQIGDVIQYDKKPGDGVWDHSVIVVGRDDNGIVLVASHSTDHEEIRYDYIDFDNIRLIHIERNDGMPPIKRFVASANDDENTRDCDGYFLGNEVYLGKCDDGEHIVSGFRFADVQIPQGATIKYAFITFSVDGHYEEPISLKIYGEATGNAAPFTGSNPLAERPTTSHFVIWDVTETWDLTDNLNGAASKYSFTTPQLAEVIQEVVQRPDWSPGNALAIIIKDNNSSTHRRVIAFERASIDPKLFPARLIVAYEGGTTAPTATPTPTPTFTPTATPTSTLTPTPTPLPTATPTSPLPGWAPVEKTLMRDESLQKQETFSDLLSRFRDEVLLQDPKGMFYVRMIYRYAPEVSQLLARDEHLRMEVKDIALEAQPLLESMTMGGTSRAPRLSAAWVEKALRVLDDVEAEASPGLKREIEWWKERLPDFVGKSGREIWEMLPERKK